MTGPPRDYVTTGAWPEGRVTRSAPVAVRYAQEITRRITAASAGWTQTALAEQAGLARSTLHDIVTGRTWPDVVTLAKLEAVLQVKLWPEELPPAAR